MVEIDGARYVQSIAILRMLGKKYGYYPEDSELAYQIDSFVDGLYDLLNFLIKGFNEPTQER